MFSRGVLSFCIVLAAFLLLMQQCVSDADYGLALTKSLLYFEAQRSGKLPPNQRVQWRGDSGLSDGKDNGVDLVGGYYDAGDNVKFGFPMGFTITMLSWGVIDFQEKFLIRKELTNAVDAIKWGTDYLIKAHPQPNVLYGQVGDGDSDHDCWQRPEDMTTPRNSYKIDETNPGSDLAGETAAAFAAAAIAIRSTNYNYSGKLLEHAKQLFHFATTKTGKYSDGISSAAKFYPSSGFQDELLWAAAWILRAEPSYGPAIDYLQEHRSSDGGVRQMFSWDDKFVGVQTLIELMVSDGTLPDPSRSWDEYKRNAEEFICNCVGKGDSNVKKTHGGLLWWQPWNDLQYTTAALFVITVYSDNLDLDTVDCQNGSLSSSDLINFVRSQVDYILGKNPKNISYLVGLGQNYPQKLHHRGSSIVSIKKDSTPVTCKGGYDIWFKKDAPDPNLLDGAIVGGPDLSDNYEDDRNNFQQAEPAIANTAPLVGILARLA